METSTGNKVYPPVIGSGYRADKRPCKYSGGDSLATRKTLLESPTKTPCKIEWDGIVRETGERAASPPANKRGRPKKWDRIPAPSQRQSEKRKIGRPKKWLLIPHVEPSEGFHGVEAIDEMEEGQSREMEPPVADLVAKSADYEPGLEGNCRPAMKEWATTSAVAKGKSDRLWSIKVLYDGHIKRGSKNHLYYERYGRLPAFIHNVNPEMFRFSNLCHDVLGKLSGMKPHKVMWYYTGEGSFPDSMQPIGVDDDVKNMFRYSKDKDKCIARVVCQRDTVEYRIQNGEIVETYRIPTCVPMLPPDVVVPWEKIERMITAKENALSVAGEEELRKHARRQRKGMQWYVSFEPDPYDQSKESQKAYDHGFYDDSYIKKL